MISDEYSIRSAMADYTSNTHGCMHDSCLLGLRREQLRATLQPIRLVYTFAEPSHNSIYVSHLHSEDRSLILLEHVEAKDLMGGSAQLCQKISIIDLTSSLRFFC